MQWVVTHDPVLFGSTGPNTGSGSNGGTHQDMKAFKCIAQGSKERTFNEAQ